MQPKRQKYRKQFRGHSKGSATRGTTLAFGEYGIKSLGRGWLTAKQIEAARRSVANSTKRGGKLWIRVFPDKPTTSKAAGGRMGGGKGDIKEYVAVVTPGRIIFELGGTTEEVAREAFKAAAARLPFDTRVITRV